MGYATVLIMHGAPPQGFPREEMLELFSLHARMDSIIGPERTKLEKRYHELEEKMCRWPRTRENDPFFAASCDIAEALQKALNCKVFIGFNEFCAPKITEAIDRAASQKPDKIIVVTPMMTPGGEHSEKDIPAAISQARGRYPKIPMVYAWPYAPEEIAGFLSEHVRRFV